MNQSDIEKLKITLWMHYNDQINDTQYFYRMNQYGFNSEQAESMFNAYSSYLNSLKKKNNTLISFTILCLIVLTALVSIWNIMT